MRERGGASRANKRNIERLVRRVLLVGRIEKLPRPNQRQLLAEDSIRTASDADARGWGYEAAKDTMIRDLKWIKKQLSTT